MKSLFKFLRLSCGFYSHKLYSQRMETAEEPHATTPKPATTVEALRLALEQMGLSTKGHKPELKQRYRKAVKKQKETADAVKAAKAPLEPTEEPTDTRQVPLFFTWMAMHADQN